MLQLLWKQYQRRCRASMLALRFCTGLILVSLSVRKTYLFEIKDLRYGCNTTDLKRFWNTTEPIWTVTTADTENSGLSCLVDVKENDTGSYTYFQRSHNVSSTQERKTVEFKGYVSPGNKFDRTAMLLYYTNNTLYAKEDLLYESPDSSCGVIKFFHHPEVIRLDLRVKNSSIETGRHTICFQYFLQAVKYYQSKPPYPDIKNRTLYNSSCQAILKSLKSGC
nr:uncharacterized protein LOC126534351 isoform X2 [Dermacentor andersoni]